MSLCPICLGFSCVRLGVILNIFHMPTVQYQPPQRPMATPLVL